MSVFDPDDDEIQYPRGENLILYILGGFVFAAVIVAVAIYLF